MVFEYSTGVDVSKSRSSKLPTRDIGLTVWCQTYFGLVDFPNLKPDHSRFRERASSLGRIIQANFMLHVTASYWHVPPFRCHIGLQASGGDEKTRA